jgi:hypothetical protein
MDTNRVRLAVPSAGGNPSLDDEDMTSSLDVEVYSICEGSGDDVE